MFIYRRGTHFLSGSCSLCLIGASEVEVMVAGTQVGLVIREEVAIVDGCLDRAGATTKDGFDAFSTKLIHCFAAAR